MAKAKQLRSKTPDYPSRAQRIRNRALEILFFVALGVFGFSLVMSILGGDEADTTISIVPDFSVPNLGHAEPVAAIGLYEAPSQRPEVELTLSPIFTPSVQYWKDDLIRWATDAGLDPNLAATVMQIESCGNPNARSWAGATGLFQVMPFHFEADEDPYNPDTNAYRGMLYLDGGLEASGGHAGLALAGYNGGHGVIYKDYSLWAHETQRYYRWGSGIYREASAGWESSPTLATWLEAGGQSLCYQAEEVLGITGVPTSEVTTH